MNKTVYKFRPSDYWRIGEHESWFSDMAAQGFHLKKMGIHFAKFVKGQPTKMRYRIDVAMNKRIAEEQIQMYTDYGWDYVTSYGVFRVFSSAVNSGAPELHTDPTEQSYTLKQLDKKLVMNASIVIISMLLMIGMLLSIWFLDGTPTYILVEGHAIQQTLLTLVIGYLAYTLLQAAISIRILRKKLIEGKPIDHTAPWKKRHRVNLLISLLFIMAAALTVVLSIVYLVTGETKTLPEGNLDLPIVRLADVEKNPAFIRGEPEYVKDNIDWGNSYTYNWSPLTTVQYDTDETGIIPGEMWADGSGEYSPSIHTRVYQLRVGAMADYLISDLVKRSTYGEYSAKDFVETNHSELDLLIIHEEEAFKEVFAAKGKTVIYVRYYGYATISSLLENIVEKIEFISE